jgi:hypothetical protein
MKLIGVDERYFLLDLENDHIQNRMLNVIWAVQPTPSAYGSTSSTAMVDIEDRRNEQITLINR